MCQTVVWIVSVPVSTQHKFLHIYSAWLNWLWTPLINWKNCLLNSDVASAAAGSEEVEQLQIVPLWE